MSLTSPITTEEWMQPSENRTIPVRCIKNVNSYHVGDVIYSDPYYIVSLTYSYKDFGPYWELVRQCRKPS